MDNDILKEIRQERDYQDNKYGTAFDDKNTLNDWVTYIVNYLGKSAFSFNKEEQREYMLKAAALAVAALEAYERNNGFPARHYDKE
jgi:hypothetical protein